MPKKKKQKKESEGNMLGAAIVGVVVAIFGMFLGIGTLALEDVKEVRDMPAEDKITPDTVYYVIGKDKGSAYKGDEQAFLDGKVGIIRMTEEELNDWAGDNFKFGRPKPGEEQGGFITLRPSTPNFRIQEGVLQVGMSVEVIAFGKNYKVRYQAKGNQFIDDGLGFVFKPDIAYLGSAQLPPVVVSGSLADMLFQVFEQSEQYAKFNEAWRGLSNVAVEGNELVLVRE
ncbi:MAG: hypothetical protein AAFX93_02890 [Verrucomicrobiota bacterium]